MKISLHLIVKNEVANVIELAEGALPYVADIYLTVSDKTAYNELTERLKDKNIYIDYRKWNNRFDDARNHNWELGKDADASMWIDADDSFDFSKLPKLAKLLDTYDAVFLPYHYDHDENGNVIVYHWRERLVRRDKPFYWKGWVHENLICDAPFTKINVEIPIIHLKNGDTQRQKSADRNHEILLQAYGETNDPRYIHYLGVSYFTMKDFDNAIKLLKEYITVGGWDEEIYRSLLKIAEAYYMKDDQDAAMTYALKAVQYLPQYPMAYYLLANFEFQLDNWKECLEWTKMALAKPVPKNASIYDPTAQDRAVMQGAICEFSLGNYRDAVELIKRVKTMDISDVLPEFEYEASIERLKAILPALAKHYQNPKLLWENLHDDIKYRPEFRKIREQYTLPSKWASNSVVFFCGKGYEEWGPHTLDKGMGGSEEAIVYLAPQLAKLGYQVTVFGEVSEPFTQDGVDWKPWTHIDKRDNFNILVIWRMPDFCTQFKAKKMLVDMHDVIPSKTVKPYEGVTYLFKSQYHKDLYPQITDYAIIPNGIQVDQFKPVKKQPYSIIYPSAYYRGLETLIDMWPKIKKEVPEATLDIYYGWQSWVSFEGEDEFYHRMNDKLARVANQGVTEHGRVDHKTLAEKFAESKLWAYPTEFPEIFCITAVKANLAGCKPVITDVAALKETGGPSATFIETDRIAKDEYAQEKFVKAVVDGLKTEHDAESQIEWAKQFDWQNIAEQWMERFDG